jgi:hypothetical protein
MSLLVDPIAPFVEKLLLLRENILKDEEGLFMVVSLDRIREALISTPLIQPEHDFYLILLIKIIGYFKS